MTNLMTSTTESALNIPKRGMPVTIITGFLGSGKTTLLNQILTNKKDLKVAVLVNEFGDINIDSQLLVSLDEDMVELSNGCICCTINDGLVDAVYRVLERDSRIDYLVIETTGIADPLPIILTFVGTELRDLTQLDSILTLVDAEAFTPDHFNSEAALKQIYYGDMILLNKIDLVSSQKLEEVQAYIRNIKAGARIIPTQYGQVPLPLILGIGMTPVDRFTQDTHSDRHHHDHHSHHLENDGFVSLSFESESPMERLRQRPFSVHKFEQFLTQQMPQNIFRAKGILWFRDSDLRHIFQLSGSRYDMNAEQWVSSPKKQLVLIGRDLDIAQVQQQLNECLV
ncbi:GTP-binding protein [Gloeocapsa sp. BRSZ]